MCVCKLAHVLSAHTHAMMLKASETPMYFLLEIMSQLTWYSEIACVCLFVYLFMNLTDGSSSHVPPCQ